MSGAEVTNLGLVTTPQLHYIVRCLNTKFSENSYGEPSELGYYVKMADACKQVLCEYPSKKYSIIVDAGNGVGGPKIKELTRFLCDNLDIRVVNNHYDTASLLNANYGIDYVKKHQKLPVGVNPEPYMLYASIDGDADRIHFYYIDKNKSFILLDSDKIAALCCLFLTDLVAQSGTGLRIGVVQTPVSNGGSTEYLTETLKVSVDCALVGLKRIRFRAQQFDIGIYFEPEGHGTVLFSDNATNILKSFQAARSPAQQSAIKSLLALSNLINQTTGDAISNLLLILSILSITRLSPSDWNSLYTDYPSWSITIEVKDHANYKIADEGRKLSSPYGLQPKIDALVKKFERGRAVLRPSRIENAVHIYAEALSKIQANELSLKIAQLLATHR